MLSHFVRKLGTIIGWRFAGRSEIVRAGGLVWQLAPNASVRLGLNDLALAGQAELVKQNHQRTISRVSLPFGTVYVKRCRPNTPRAWAREVLRPPKARLEFENALRLRELGIPAIEPLAWASSPGLLPSESVLLTREQSEAVPFLTLLEDALPKLPPAEGRAVRRQLARTLAAFLAKLHDAGVSHPDPHPGNLLVELPPSRVPHFFLTDLHAIRFGRALNWAETKANLTLMNRWFQMRASRADRARFWHTYLNMRNTLETTDRARMAKELELATAASNHRFWANRTDRYRANNREYRRVSGVGVNGHAVRDFPDEVLRGWLADPDAVFAQSDVVLLKDGRSSTVARLMIPSLAGPRAIIFKRFRLKSRLDAVKNALRPSEALRSWQFGHGLRDRGLPTARPLAMLHRRWRGLPAEGYVAFEVVPDAIELAQHADLRPLVDPLGRLLRAMHDRQVSHRDLKAPNILLAYGVEPVLIDLVGVEAGRNVPFARRVRDLARLNASFRDSPQLTRTDRLRLLRAYLRWGLHGPGNWKDWWIAIERATAVKAAKNVRNGRPLT